MVGYGGCGGWLWRVRLNGLGGSFENKKGPFFKGFF